jgi:hypothetical protein
MVFPHANKYTHPYINIGIITPSLSLSLSLSLSILFLYYLSLSLSLSLSPSSLTNVWDAVIAKAVNGGKLVGISEGENEGGAFVRTQNDGVLLQIQHTSSTIKVVIHDLCAGQYEVTPSN